MIRSLDKVVCIFDLKVRPFCRYAYKRRTVNPQLPIFLPSFLPLRTSPYPVMSPEFEAVQKFKETLETGNFDLVTPFMLDDFTHEMFPKTYVRHHHLPAPSLRP